MHSDGGTANDAAIEIVEYQARWPSMFETERQLIAVALAPWLCAPIEHIGSTAVPGLPAKPIIDIMAPVRSLEESLPAIQAAALLGYLYHPYKGEVMHWFCKPSPAVRTHHLHLVPYEGATWRQRISFRQALRGSQTLARQYAQLKYTLAVAFPRDRETYTSAKEPFILGVLEHGISPDADATWQRS
jgi:GrpB-like predicted nucleotidyltransferase (UPF0157 family)